MLPPVERQPALDSDLDVLVVDDEAPSLELLVARVRMAGVMPRAFSSPYDALVAVGERVPDVVVTDYNMPGLDGLELAARIRAAGWAPRPFIIVTSASVELSSTSQIRISGADAFVPKSISFRGFEAELLAAQRALRRAP